MFDNLKSYFKNLPCYWSVNLFAMVGFLALIIKNFFFNKLQNFDLLILFGAFGVNGRYAFLIAILLSTLVFFIKDIINPKLLKNTEITNNKYYRRLVIICFVFSMIFVFIPTGLFLILLFSPK